jgi:hypothetical protein
MGIWRLKLLAGTRHVQPMEGGESSSGQSAVISPRYGQGQAETVSTNAIAQQESHLEIARSTPQPDLLFVMYTSPSEIASQNLRHVRSHVMHQHLRRRRRSEEAETSEEPVTEAKCPRINLLPGAGRVDPLDTLSVTMTRAMSRLFDHCKRPCWLRYCLAVLP